MFTKIRNFTAEAVSELRKVSWLTQKDLVDSTKIVLISIAMLGTFIAVIDLILSRCLSFIIR